MCVCVSSHTYVQLILHISFSKLSLKCWLYLVKTNKQKKTIHNPCKSTSPAISSPPHVSPYSVFQVLSSATPHTVISIQTHLEPLPSALLDNPQHSFLKFLLIFQVSHFLSCSPAAVGISPPPVNPHTAHFLLCVGMICVHILAPHD